MPAPRPCAARGQRCPSGLGAILFPPALARPFVSSTEIPHYKLFHSRFHTVITNLVPFAFPFESGAYLQRHRGCCILGAAAARSEPSPGRRQVPVSRSHSSPVLPQPRGPHSPAVAQRTLRPRLLLPPCSRRCLFSPSSGSFRHPQPPGQGDCPAPPPH